MEPAARHRVLSALGLLLAALLAVWMVRRVGDPSALLAAFRDALRHPGWLALGLALLGVSLLAGTVRWHLILRSLEIPLPFREVLRLYLAGHFCSIFATGSTGGDVVKAAIVAARFPGRRLRAVSSILFERVIGFMSLDIPLGLLAILLWPSIDSPGVRNLLYLLLAATLLFTLLFLLWPLVFLPDWPGLLARRAFFRRSRRLQGALAPLLRIWQDFRDVLTADRRAVSSIAQLSVLNHVVAALCGVAMARAAGIGLPVLPVAAAMLLANAVAILPLTPGGVGLREASAMGLLCSLGAADSQAAAAGFLVFGATLAWAAVGAAAWFALKRPSSHPQQPTTPTP